MKELPYFRFTPSEWQNGKISLEDFELQGYFINVCSYYWISDCSITRVMLEKKYRSAKSMLELCLELDIFQHNPETDFISINFLNEQFDTLCRARKVKQLAGSKGGTQKAKNASCATILLEQNPSYKDKDKDKDKDKNIESQKAEIPIFDFAKSLIELGVEKKIVADWIRVRKTKKGSNTETAFKAIQKNIEQSEISANECIKMAVEKSWCGFESEWVKNNLRNEENKRGYSASKTVNPNDKSVFCD